MSGRLQGPQPSADDSADAERPLAERAAEAARAELQGERTGILGALGSSAPQTLLRARRVPERWSLIFVMERLEEAFRILSRLPIATRPRGYINSMPFHLYDRGDLNAQNRCRRSMSRAWCITSAALPCSKTSSAPSRHRATAARAVPQSWIVEGALKGIISWLLSHFS